MDRPIPSDAIYTGLIGKLTKELAPHTEAHPVGVLASLLSYFSVAIGSGPYVSLEGADDRQPLVFWPMLMGVTGEGKKGTATKHAARVFKRVEEEFNQNHYYHGFPASGAAFISGLAKAAQAAGWIDEDSVPVDPQTGEPDYSKAPVKPGYPILYVKEEWAQVMMACRSDKDLGDAVRLAWQASELVNDTRKDGRVRIQRPHVGIIGHVTPDEFKACLSPSELAGGTFNRFITLYVHKSRSLPRGGRLTISDYERMATEVRQAVEFAQGYSDLIEFSDSAWDYWEENVYDVLPTLATDSEVMRGFCARSLGYVKRMAALFALADCRKQITIKDLKAAEALFRYCIESVRYVMGEGVPTPGGAAGYRMTEVTINADGSKADPAVVHRVVAMIRDAGSEGLKTGDISRNVSVTKLELERAFAAAMDQGLIKRFRVEGTGGAPGFRYFYTGPDEVAPLLVAADERTQKPVKVAKPEPPKAAAPRVAAPQPAEPAGVSTKAGTTAKPASSPAPKPKVAPRKKAVKHDPLLDLL
ncbi:DUF3987 domain-containing protein [Streptosporangium canum]|uniref:DUF3987 domain-containing protein n=1 Tax=Streptosporangium canum TaxID=324952 RepID=UPI0036B90D96